MEELLRSEGIDPALLIAQPDSALVLAPPLAQNMAVPNGGVVSASGALVEHPAASLLQQRGVLRSAQPSGAMFLLPPSGCSLVCEREGAALEVEPVHPDERHCPSGVNFPLNMHWGLVSQSAAAAAAVAEQRYSVDVEAQVRHVQLRCGPLYNATDTLGDMNRDLSIQQAALQRYTAYRHALGV